MLEALVLVYAALASFRQTSANPCEMPSMQALHKLETLKEGLEGRFMNGEEPHFHATSLFFSCFWPQRCRSRSVYQLQDGEMRGHGLTPLTRPCTNGHKESPPQALHRG